MGSMSDARGRKSALMLSFVGSAIGYIIVRYSKIEISNLYVVHSNMVNQIGAANNLWLLVLSRVPVGLVKQTMTISKAYITDVTEPQTR